MHVERTPLNSAVKPVVYGDPRLPARLWAKITDADGCWLWTGGVNTRPRHVYGSAWYEGRNWTPHRLAFHLLVRPILSDEDAHHDGCPSTLCANPNHVIAVPRAQHWGHGQADKTHCPHGHEYSPGNTLTTYRARTATGTVSPNRMCRTCLRESVDPRRR